MFVEPSSASESAYSLLQESVGLLRLPDVSVFAITGEDRKGWLQGQVTNDLRNLRDGGRISACLCSPTGQLQAVVDIYSAEDTLYVVTAQPDVLSRRVEDFVVLEQVEFSTVAQGIVSYQGPKASKLIATLVELPNLDVYSDENFLFLRNDRTGMGGWDAVANSAQPLPEATEVDKETALIASLEAGYPVLGVDTDERTLPPELGRAFEDLTVNYKKGCYQGQEILMRLHSRGHTNKTWVGLLCDAPVNPGDQVTFAGESMGKVTRSANSPKYGHIAAATLKNRATFEGAIVQIAGTTAEVVHMPILTYD